MAINLKKSDIELEILREKNNNDTIRILALVEENENITIRADAEAENNTPRPNLRPVLYNHNFLL